jgi:stage II sporulation protein D (peptidoglycan lytic transglycosylase)
MRGPQRIDSVAATSTHDEGAIALHRPPIERINLILRGTWRGLGGSRRTIVVFTPFVLMTILAVGCFTFSDRGPQDVVQKPDRQPPKIITDRLVRVRMLGPAREKSLTLEVSSGYELRAGPGGRVIEANAAPLAKGVVGPAPDGGILLGETRYPETDLFITPKRDASIVLNGTSTYRGLLRIVRSGDKIALTNHIDIESYLKGVLRGELPKHFHRESFKAQCVAARTYVLYQMKSASSDRTFDVYDNEGSQMYIGVTGEGPKAVAAVEETAGEVCVWPNGDVDTLFCTYYSSACGGQSQHVNNVKPRDPDVPPLAGQVVCNDCYLATYYEWDPVRVTKAELTKCIVKRYPSVASLGEITGLRPKEIEPGGRIVRIQLDGKNGTNETLIGEDFRLCVGGHKLKSTKFTIEDDGDAFVFRNGKGFGHGIGLCQNGMELKARRNLDYRTILKTYYPGCDIRKLY